MDGDQFEEVMLSLGHAVFAAQLFEMNLATTLIALTIARGDRSKFPDEAAVRKWLDHVDRLPIGQLKGQISSLGLLPERMVEEIGEINRRRVGVVHHFVNLWSDRLDDEEGQRQAVEHLEAERTIFLIAAKRLQGGLEKLQETELPARQSPT